MSLNLVDAIVNMKEKEVLELANGLIRNGEDPLKILGLCKEAMEIVGNRYEDGTYFLPELVMAGEMLTKISEMLKPILKLPMESDNLGKVLIGTVEGDIHDIGKNIVVFLLDVNGFEVTDLGIDVPPKKFVDAIQGFGPDIVGLSGFLTLAFDSMKDTVDAIKKAGLREKVKIMIGGGQVDDNVRQYAGADAYGLDALDAVKLSKKWRGGEASG